MELLRTAVGYFVDRKSRSQSEPPILSPYVGDVLTELITESAGDSWPAPGARSGKKASPSASNM